MTAVGRVLTARITNTTASPYCRSERTARDAFIYVIREPSFLFLPRAKD